MPAGQPTKYTDDTIGIASAYIYGGFTDAGDMIPQTEGLAEKLEVCVKTLYNWGDAHPEFLQVLQELQSRQRKELINKGLDGTFNSNITKLVLGKHGFHDKTDQTHSAPGGGPVEWTVLPVAPNPSSAETITTPDNA